MRFALDATGPDNDDYLNMCVEFDRVTEGLSFDILDIDDAGWDDVVELYYTSTPSATPMLARTDLINGSGFGDLSTGTDPNHVVAHDPGLAAPNNEATGWGAIQPNGGNAGNNDDGGNVSIDFGATQVWGFCLRYWAGPDSDADPPFQWMGFSALNWTSSLPVNLDQFSSKRSGRQLHLKWSTSSETFNLGFNLWAEVDGEWQSINRRIIPSNGFDSNSILQYEKTVRLNRELRRANRLGISSIDTSGNEEFFGPFEIGEEYGEQSVPEPIDWHAVLLKNDSRMRAKGFTKRHNRWVKKAPHSKNAPLNIDLEFAEEGIARVTHFDLLEQGIDLRGQNRNEIAVTHRGKAVARRVYIGGKSKQFNDASYIDFYAQRLEGELALYNASNVYQISLDPEKVLHVRTVKRSTSDVEEAPTVVRSKLYEQNTTYKNFSTLGSPWLDASIGWGASNSLDRAFNLPSDYVPGTDIELTLRLMGGFDFPYVELDHKTEVFVNGHFIGQRSWGSIDAQVFKFQVTSELLKGGENTLSLKAITTDAGFALAHFDNFEVSYQALAQVNGGTTSFSLANEERADWFVLEQHPRERLWAYATDKTGNLLRLKHSRLHSDKRQKTGTRNMLFPMLNDASSRYWVLTEPKFVQPKTISLTAIDELNIDRASLYIVADESFLTDELIEYADFKRTMGITTEIVSYQSLLTHFGHGLNDPYVITRFLKHQGAVSGDTSLLIVGGHTYDYLDRTGVGSLSFIPTVYRSGGVIQYSPTDSPLVDLDGDKLPDVAVGRWPVRTAEQLTVIIQKSTEWAEGKGLASSSNVLLIADNDDRNNSLDFSKQLDELAKKYDSSGSTYPSFWGDVTRIYADDFSDSSNSVAEQQAAISAAMTLGSGLTVYNGHASTTSWSFKRYFDVNAIESIDYQAGANIVIPLACYTTYYETLSNESLANKLLFHKDGGAVAVAGAATLGDYQSNGKVMSQLMRQTASKKVSLGEALRLAKRSLGRDKTAQANLWALLADPTIEFHQGYQKPQSPSTLDLEYTTPATQEKMVY